VPTGQFALAGLSPARSSTSFTAPAHVTSDFDTGTDPDYKRDFSPIMSNVWDFPPFESGNYALKLSSPLFGGQGIEFTDVAPQAFQVGIDEGYARFMIVLCCQHRC
jgi:hypothetical protein